MHPHIHVQILQTAVKLREDQEWEYAMEASFIEASARGEKR